MYKLDGKYVNLTDHCKQVEVGVTSKCRIRLLYSSPNVAVLVEWHPVHPNVGPKMGLGGLLTVHCSGSLLSDSVSADLYFVSASWFEKK